jgi:hypothetical protein
LEFLTEVERCDAIEAVHWKEKYFELLIRYEHLLSLLNIEVVGEVEEDDYWKAINLTGSGVTREMFE